MTLQIKSFDLSKQHQEEALGFHHLSSAETAKCTDAGFAPLQKAYTDAIEGFDAALKTGGASILSDQLADVDAQVDKTYSGLVTAIHNNLKHFNPAMVAAAKEAMMIIDHNGSPVDLPYVEENAAVHNIIQDLEAFDAGTDVPSGGGGEGGGDTPNPVASDPGRLTLLGARDWLDHLKELNTEFATLFARRNAEQSTLVTGASTAARTVVDDAYAAVVRRINALAEVNGDAAYADIINALNRLIDYQKAVLAARKTTNAKANDKKNGGSGDAGNNDTQK